MPVAIVYGFRDDPKLMTAKLVGAEKPAAVFERLVVSPDVLGFEIAPIANHVTPESRTNLEARECLERSGRSNDATQLELSNGNAMTVRRVHCPTSNRSISASRASYFGPILPRSFRYSGSP